MEASPRTLRQAADAVDAFGCSSAEYRALTDDEALAAQHVLATARALIDTRSSWLAGTIAERSRPELGLSGLAARHGFTTPEAMVQNGLGTTRSDASKFVQVGRVIAATETAVQEAAARHAEDPSDRPDTDTPEAGAVGAGLPWQTPIVHFVSTGQLSPTAADAILRGLGTIDQAVTADKLAEALSQLLPELPGLTAEQVYKRARRLRDELDAAGIRAREKQARDDTVWKIWRRDDGMITLHALLPVTLFVTSDGVNI